MNGDDPKNHRRVRRAFERYFRKRTSPRFLLGLVIVLTGFAGFGISVGLLKLGVTLMVVRYPVAVFGAYGIFLVLIRIWAEFERWRFDPDDPEVRRDLEEDDDPPVPAATRETNGRWWDALDLPADLIPADEGCLVAILIGAFVALGILLISALGAAPILIAEVFVDVVLAGLLYRRLKAAQTEHWLATAIQKTWSYVLGVAALLAIIGGLLDLMATDSDTMGRALKEVWRIWRS